MSPMRKESRNRLIALAIGSLVAASLGFLAWRARPRQAAVELVDNSLSQQAEWTTHQLMPRGLLLPSGVPGAEEQFQRRVITREEVARVLGLGIFGQREYDPLRLFRYRANVREVTTCPEHPKGRWIRATNSEGAREDHEFPLPAPDLFVLVAGDSHTEGMCDNSESYSNSLERELAKKHQDRRVEVYNTGVSGYTFYNYLGVLEDSLARKPDVFVTTFFGGNDFFEVLKIQHLYAGTVPPPRSYGYWSRFRAAEALSAGALAQGLNQLLFLRDNPDQTEVALKAALFATSEIQRLCTENDVEWIAVYLPSAFDLPFPDLAELRARMKEALTIADADFEIGNRMADQLLHTLRERGVAVLDLRPVFGADSQALYWSDMHINLHGQEVVANALLPRVEALLAERATRHTRANAQRDRK